MLKIIKVIFFISLIFPALNLFSEDYSTIVQGNDEDVSELLQKALNQSILKVLGSQRDFNLNQKKLKKLNPDNFVKQYKFIKFNDEEALEAFKELTKVEGIMPALETAHGIAYVKKIAPTMSKEQTIIVNVSGRGDKDINTVASIEGIEL